MFPSELTFGVFDAIVMSKQIAEPCIWFTSVHEKKKGAVFLVAVDGGTNLDSIDDTKRRFSMHCYLNSPNIAPREGDIVKLLAYRMQLAANKEPVLIITDFETIRNSNPPPRQIIDAYPYITAPTDLQKSRKSVYNKNYDLQCNLEEEKCVRHSELPDNQIKLQRQTDIQHQDSGHQLPQQLSTKTIVKESSAPDEHKDSNSYSPKNLYPELPNSIMIRNADISQPKRNAYQAFGNPSRPFNQQMLHQQTHYRPNRRESQEEPRAAPYATQYSSGGPVAYRVDPKFIPIKSLTQLLSRWKVRGRFINVEEPRPFSNAKGEGKIWNMELVDSSDEKGTIRCTLFTRAVDKFRSVIKENQIFTVSRGTIKTANKQFNSGVHDFEMQLGEDADIKWVAEDDPTIPAKTVAKVFRISELSTIPKGSLASVCGVVIRWSDAVEITSKQTGRPYVKRDLTILDESETLVDVTLWGKKAEAINLQDSSSTAAGSDKSVVLVENARVDDYNGRRLGSISQTTITLNPRSPDVSRLIQWYKSVGRLQESQFSSLSLASAAAGVGVGGADNPLITVAEIKQRVLVQESDLEDKGVWFTCRATLIKINREKQYYWLGCPTCTKKVVYSSSSSSSSANDFSEDGFGLELEEPPVNTKSFCNFCQKDVDQPTKKYLLNSEIADSTGTLNCVALGDKGNKLMGGITADELAEFGANPEKPLADYFEDREGRLYKFRILAKMERYRDEPQVKYKLFECEPLSGDEVENHNKRLPAGSSATTCDSNATATAAAAATTNAGAKMRENIIKDGRATINWIYSVIQKVSRVP